MLTVVAVDPAAVPAGESARAVSALVAFARRYECLLACAERSPGDTARFLAALREALPAFRFVALFADPDAPDPVDVRLLTELLDDGALPVVVTGDVPAMPLAAAVAASIGADSVWRLADGPDGVTLHITDWLPIPA